MMSQHNISLLPFQLEVLNKLKDYRYVAMLCGRRVGKSHLMCVAALQSAVEHAGSVSLLLGVTQEQVKGALWETLQEVTPAHYIKKLTNSPHQIMRLKNGSRIELRATENHRALRGRKSPQFIGCDEIAFAHDGVYQNVLHPMSMDKKDAKFLLASTPNYPGDEMHKAYLRGQSDDHPKWWSCHHTCADVREDMREEIEEARNSLDPASFKREYEAHYSTLGNKVFTDFSRDVHVKEFDDLYDEEVVHIAIDFNINLMCAASFVVRDGIILWLQDFKGSFNTDELARVLKDTYPNRKICVYPDPSGASNKTSASGETDHSILKKAGFEVRTKSRTPSIKDSVNIVNAKLLNANGKTTMFFHPRCEDLIKSVENTVFQDDTGSSRYSILKNGEEHFSDGLRYAVDYLYGGYNAFKTHVSDNIF